MPKIKLRSIADCVTDLTPGELGCLFAAIDRAHRLPCDRKLYCEVGVFKGGAFLQAMRHVDSLERGENDRRWDCIGIDLFEDFRESRENTHISGAVNRDELDDVLQGEGFHGYWLFKGNSVHLLHTLVSLYRIAGVVFIDANHTYEACREDCMAALQVLDRGYLVLHNASEKEAIDNPHTNGGPLRVACELVNGVPGVEWHIAVERCVVLEKRA